MNPFEDNFDVDIVVEGDLSSPPSGEDYGLIKSTPSMLSSSNTTNPFDDDDDDDIDVDDNDHDNEVYYYDGVDYHDEEDYLPPPPQNPFDDEDVDVEDEDTFDDIEEESDHHLDADSLSVTEDEAAPSSVMSTSSNPFAEDEEDEVVEEEEEEEEDGADQGLKEDGAKVSTAAATGSKAVDRDGRLVEDTLTNLKSTNEIQADKIAVLVDKIKSLEQNQLEVRETNLRLRDQLEYKDNKISALEELFANINTNRHFNYGIGNLVDTMDDEYSLEAGDVDDDDDDGFGLEDVDLNEPVEVSLDHPRSNLSKTVRAKQHRSLVYRTESEVQEESMEVLLLADRLEMEQRHHETAKNLVECLEQDLGKQKMEVMAAQTKAEHRATLLRDMIGQYKELQVDHDDTLEELQVLNNRIESFKEYHHTLELELRQYRGTDQSKTLSSSKLQEESNDSLVEKDASATMTKMEATPERTSDIMDEGDDASLDLTADITEASTSYHTTVVDHSVAADKNIANSTIQKLAQDKAKAEKEIKNLEKECDRLQHEFDTAIHKILALEVELSDGNDNLKKAESKIGNLQGEVSRLEQQTISSDETSGEKLLEEIQEELQSLKEQKEDLEQKLEKAIADLDSSLDESNAVRAQLTECSVKYDQMQQQYQDLTEEKKALQISLRKETAERKGLEQLRAVSWLPEKIDELVEQQTKAEEELTQLKLENADLKKYCADVLELASKSVEAM
mmetsp:Transcript_51326/g.123902  ORF Transcript_51326/g.123902 Transcript_51326/m.123902 type:complete len:732 (-) Transcript_51326:136-2331(-)